MKYVTTLAFISLLLSSCAKVYYSPDANMLASAQSKLAILPPKVTINPSKKIFGEQLESMELDQSISIQNELSAWILKRKMQGKITQEIQDVETTNARLKLAGYPNVPIEPKEMCQILGVDGIISSNFTMSKPMEIGTAIAVSILVGSAFASTNEVITTLKITDCKGEKMIWSYDQKYSGSIGSSPSRLVDALMKNASRKMPYIQK